MVQLEEIKRILEQQPEVEFAVLVGSRVAGRIHPQSDWDIALSWNPALSWLQRVAQTETLRRMLARALHEPESLIDLIDLADCNLVMRALVAEEGHPIKGENHNAWVRYLRRTWRELEEVAWEQHHAA
jgi:predicted nucleotidyltransferase